MHILFLVASLSLILSPIVSFAATTTSVTAIKSCCSKMKSGSGCASKSCCNNKQKQDTQNKKSCSGECGFASCSCQSINFIVALPLQINEEEKAQKAFFECTYYTGHTANLSQGFASLWTLPKIA